MHYFGPWGDPDGALARYLAQKDALHAGRKPRPEPGGGLTVKELANAFLNAKQDLLNSGELAPRTWAEYKQVTDLLVGHFGKARLVEDLDPDDFAQLRKKMAGKWGPVRLGNTIQRTRCIFKFAYDAGLIDRPVRYGPGFARPSKKTLRLHRAGRGVKLFEAEKIHKLLEATGPQMRAMVLLAINAGFGNSDCAKLPLTALDLDTGWVRFPRPKTGIDRRAPLWPETIQAVREALARRPDPKDPAHAGLVFITKFGVPWVEAGDDKKLSKEFGRLLGKLGINGRKGLGFYTLRHTFRTVADEALDQPAADMIMGHEVPHMSSVYRETISDARLRRVSEHVRHWLFGLSSGQAGADPVA
jgi:integrase